MLVVIITIVLTLCGTLIWTLRQDEQTLDQRLLSSAQFIARVPDIVSGLMEEETSESFSNFLDATIVEDSDVDIVIIVDKQNIQRYHPDHLLVGEDFPGQNQDRVLMEGKAFTTYDAGVPGIERCAYVPILDDDGGILGFVVVGVSVQNVTVAVVITIFSFGLIALIALGVGDFMSFKLSKRIRESLMGYEPEAFLGIFHQRNDILDALDEGIIAIDEAADVMYINQAASKMLGVTREEIEGKALHDLYPSSTLDRLLYSERPEHNVPLLYLRDKHILSNRLPIWEKDQVVGAVEILRNRTEATKLARDLTGVRHMVEAMRAYTHEFMNKLHVILGLLHLGEVEKAEAYIMDVTRIQQKAVGAIMASIQVPAVAALLVGKTSRCAELGIELTLGPGSSLSAEERFLPADACVTVLGNLIENAIEALNQSVQEIKQITVSLLEEKENFLICVEDTGPGIDPSIVQNIFNLGFSTKSGLRGTGLHLVNEVVKLYRGQVRVESELGVGTTFFVNFHHETKEKDAHA